MGVPRVKICGVCRGDDAEAIAALRPDAMGFVFYPPSTRAVNAAEVASWTNDFPPEITKIGVFVDTPPSHVLSTLEKAGLDIAQLHGNETVADCLEIGGVIWKALHFDVQSRTNSPCYPVDAFLVDGYCTSSPGGTGTMADWDRVAEFVEQSDKPVWLAGGLRVDNVVEAIRKVRPYGVDVSSGVEERPGKKDLSKVKDFIIQCRER